MLVCFPVFFDDLPGDGQAQSRALDFGFGDAMEGVEDASQLLFGQGPAGVGQSNVYAGSLPMDVDAENTFIGREFGALSKRWKRPKGDRLFLRG